MNRYIAIPMGECAGIGPEIIVKALLFSSPVTAVAQYLIISRLGMLNTYWALLLPALSAPLGVFLMRQFIVQMIPTALVEAARIDGMTEYGIYAKIMLPLAKPALSTLTIFTFVNTWNDFLGPYIYLTRDGLKTIQLGLRSFIGQYSSEYGLIMAGSVVTMIPVIAVFLALQKYFVEGVASTGLKG